MRRWRLVLPAAAAGGSRVIQLGVLLVILATSVGGEQALLVSGFALLSSFAIFTDSGASPYLLRTSREELGRGLHVRATAFHLVLSLTGAAAALLVAALSGGALVGAVPWLVLAALGVSGVADSVTRTTRAPLLVQRRDGAYAMPEVALTLAKIPLLVSAAVLGTPLPLAGLAAVSLAILVATFVVVRRELPVHPPLPRRVYAVILEYGVSGSLSSLYSQAPLVIGTLVLGVTAAAPLAVAYRVVQPLEFLPATVAAQLLPRLRAGEARVREWLLAFVAAGLLLAGLLWALATPIDAVLSGALVVPVFVTVLAAVPPKFANYLVVATAMARGFVLRRLVATAIVATATIVAATAVAGTERSAEAVAVVSVAAELLLLMLLGGSMLVRARRSRPIAVAT